MLEKSQKIKSKKRRWLKWLTGIILLLFFIVFILLPPVFSRLVIKPAIEEGFQQVTSNQYQIKFDALSWNILSRKINLKNIQLLSLSEDQDTSNRFLVNIDQLSLEKIRYRKLLLGNIVLDKLHMDGLNIHDHQRNEDTSEILIDHKPGFIESVLIKEIEIDMDSISVSKEHYRTFITDIHLQIDDLQWDSIFTKKQFDWPIVKQLSSSFGYFNLKNETSKLEINNCKISENRFRNFNALFERIQFSDLKTNNTLYLKWAGIKIDSVKRFYEDSTLVFSAKKMSLLSDSLKYSQEIKENFDLNRTIEELKKLAAARNIKIELDTVLSEIKNLNYVQADWKINLNRSKFGLSKFHLSYQKIISDRYSLSLGQSQMHHSKSNDSIIFKSLELSNNSVLLDKIKITPHQNQFGFKTNILKADGIDWESYFADGKVKLQKLYLFQPVFNLNQLRSSDVLDTVLPIDLDLSLLEIEEGHFKIPPKSIDLSLFDLKIDSVRGVKNKRIRIDSLFKDLQLVCNSLKVGQEESPDFLHLSRFIFDTHGGLLKLDAIKIKSRGKSSPFEINSNNLKLKGIDWRAFYRDRTTFKLDSFSVENMIINSYYINNNFYIQDTTDIRFANLIVDHVDLPKVEIDIELDKYSKLYLEDLSFIADSLVYSNKNHRPFEYSNLILDSKYTSFAQNFDSLLFTTESWSYNANRNKWRSKDVFIKDLYSEDSKKIKSVFEVNIPAIYIDGFDPYDYLIDKKVEIDTLKVLKPKFSILGERYTKPVKVNGLNWQQELRKIIERFVYIDLKHIDIDDAEVDLKNIYFGRRDEISIDTIDLRINDFYLDYQKFRDWDRFFFSDFIQFDFKNYFHSINNGNYLIDMKNGSLNSNDRTLTFNNIHFLSLDEKSQFPVNFTIDEFSLKDFYLNATSYLPELEIGNILIRKPDFQIKTSVRSGKRERVFNIDSVNLYSGFKNYVNTISLNNMDIENCNIYFPFENKKYDLVGLQAGFDGVRIDSLNEILSETKFLYADNIHFSVPQFDWVSNDRLYRYKFGKLYFNSSNGEIIIDSLRVISRYDRKTFSANLKYQKDQVDAVFPEIKLTKFDLRDALLRKRFSIERLDIYKPDLKIFKDKTLNPDTSAYKFMPAYQLKNLGFYVNIDTALVHDGFIQYEEYSGLMNIPGNVFFTNMNLRFSGLSNDKDFRDFGGALKITGVGEMMGKSRVSVNAVFQLNSEKQDFVALASMKQLDAVELNPLIQPLTLLSARKGNLMQMQMNVKGNNDYAYGQMLLKYDDLKVEVMNKNLKESNMVTFLANSFLVRKSNNNFLFPRKGPIYYERVKYRSFIHYLAHFAIVGAKTSVGIDKRKTQKMIDEVLEDEVR